MTSDAYDVVVSVLTMQDPLHRDVAMFGFCLFLAGVVQRSKWGDRGPFASFGMLLVVAFGGGFLAPILLGMDEHFPCVCRCCPSSSSLLLQQAQPIRASVFASWRQSRLLFELVGSRANSVHSLVVTTTKN